MSWMKGVARIPVGIGHIGFLLQRHLCRIEQRRERLREQYAKIGTHGADCACYFCDPQV